MTRLRTLMGKLTDVLFGNSHTNGRRKRGARPLRCEPLETRTLLAFSASVAVDVGSGPSTDVTVDEDDANLTATYSITIDDLPGFADQEGWMTLYLEYDLNEDLGDENGDVQWIDGGCYGFLSFDFETPVSPSLDLSEEIRFRVIDDGLKEDAPEWHELELDADTACYHWCGYSSGTCEMGVIPLGDAAARITIVDNDEWEVKIESVGTELEERLVSDPVDGSGYGVEAGTHLFTITRENETDIDFPLPVTVTLSGDAEWQTDYIFSTPHCNVWGCDGDFNDEDLLLDYSDFGSLADDEVVFIIPAGATSLSVEAKAADDTVVEALREELTATLSSNWMKVYYQIEDPELGGGGCCQAVPCGGYDINTGVNGNGDPLNEATVTIKDDDEITLEWSEFKDHLNMVPDPGTGLDYTGHHWEDRDGDGTVEDWERLPVAYQSGATVNIDAQFMGELDPELTGTVKIMGYALPDPNDPCIVVPTAVIDATIHSGAVKFTNGSVITLTDDMALYHDSFRIFWKFAMPGDVDASGDLIWRDAGEQINTLYATYKGAPTAEYHTVIHIGSERASGIKLDPGDPALDTEAEVDAAVVDTIWGEFSDRQVKTVAVPKADGTTAGDMTLWYYKNWTNFTNNSTQELLTPIGSGGNEHGDGACDAWTDFFGDVLAAQGIENGTPKTIRANKETFTIKVSGQDVEVPLTGFLVAQWSFNRANLDNGAYAGSSLVDPELFQHIRAMNIIQTPTPANPRPYIKSDHFEWFGGTKAGATPGNLLPAQGVNNNPASMFSAHQLVEMVSGDAASGFTVTWYDPSYGKEYERTASTEAAARSAVLDDFVSNSVSAVYMDATTALREWKVAKLQGGEGVDLNGDGIMANQITPVRTFYFLTGNPANPADTWLRDQFTVE